MSDIASALCLFVGCSIFSLIEFPIFFLNLVTYCLLGEKSKEEGSKKKSKTGAKSRIRNAESWTNIHMHNINIDKELKLIKTDVKNIEQTKWKLLQRGRVLRKRRMARAIPEVDGY